MVDDLYSASPDTRRDILTPAQREQLRAVALSWGPPTPEQRARLRPLLAGTIPVQPAAVADEAA